MGNLPFAAVGDFGPAITLLTTLFVLGMMGVALGILMHRGPHRILEAVGVVLVALFVWGLANPVSINALSAYLRQIPGVP